MTADRDLQIPDLLNSTIRMEEIEKEEKGGEDREERKKGRTEKKERKVE